MSVVQYTKETGGNPDYYDAYTTTNVYVEKVFGGYLSTINITNQSTTDDVQFSFDGATLAGEIPPGESVTINVDQRSSVYVKATTGGDVARLWGYVNMRDSKLVSLIGVDVTNSQLHVTQFLADGTEGTLITDGTETLAVNTDGSINTESFPSDNFISRAARGVLSGYATIDKFGENSDVDVGTEDLWTGGGIWVPPTQARIHQIASSDQADNGTTATGALTISLSGIIANGTRATETKTLNGTTNVPTTNAFTMIDRMEILTVGSTGSNEGTITATADTDTTVTARIEIGHNQTRMAIFQVPTNAQATMHSYYFTINGNTPAATLLTLQLKEKKNVANSPWVTKHIETFNSDVTNDVGHRFDHFKKISAGSYFKMTVTSNKADASVEGGFNLLIAND